MEQLKFAQLHKMMTIAGSNFCPTLNKPSYNRIILLKYCQTGEISHKFGHTGIILNVTVTMLFKVATQPKIKANLLAKLALFPRNKFIRFKGSFVMANFFDCQANALSLLV